MTHGPGAGPGRPGDSKPWCAANRDGGSASAAPLGASAGRRRSLSQRQRDPDLCGARTPSILEPSCSMLVPPPPHVWRIHPRCPPRFCPIPACVQVAMRPRRPPCDCGSLPEHAEPHPPRVMLLKSLPPKLHDLDPLGGGENRGTRADSFRGPRSPAHSGLGQY